MNTHQADDVIAGYRKAKDAQQQIIQELRAEISSLQSGGCARDQSTTQFCAEAVEVGEKLGAMQRHVELCRQIVNCPDDETLAEWLKGSVRLDDPVVTGLVDAAKPLQVVAEDFDSDNLDDARPHWGDTRESCRHFEIFTGRGGKPLLHLSHAFNADKALSAYEARVKEVGE